MVIETLFKFARIRQFLVKVNVKEFICLKESPMFPKCLVHEIHVRQIIEISDQSHTNREKGDLLVHRIFGKFQIFTFRQSLLLLIPIIYVVKLFFQIFHSHISYPILQLFNIGLCTFFATTFRSVHR